MSTHGVNQGNSMCGQAVTYDFNTGLVKLVNFFLPTFYQSEKGLK